MFSWKVGEGAREQCKTCARARTYKFVMQNSDFCVTAVLRGVTPDLPGFMQINCSRLKAQALFICCCYRNYNTATG